MIYDSLSNIDIYKGLSDNINTGLAFLQQAKSDLANGVYQITPRVKAIVSVYQTKQVNEYGYEAHRRFIDIQYVLKGIEKVCCLPIEKMKMTEAYSEENDVAFYTAECQPLEMIIGDGYFTIFYPQDGHMPCLCVKKNQMVKKVVIKVEIK